MTRLLIDPAADFDDPSAVTLTATLLDPAPALVRTFIDVTAATVIDIPAPAASEAWRLTVRRPITTPTRWGIPTVNPGPIVEERTVHWTGTDPLAWATLTDVDPATLKQPAGSPLLDVGLDELRAQILGGASAAHDTLKELEDALAAGSSSADVITALAGKAPLASPDFTGTPTISGVPVARTTDLAPSSSLTRSVNTITGNGTAVIGARNSVNASAGPVTITLPAPTAIGQHLIIERADTSNLPANAITITGTIRGTAGTVTLAAVGAAYEGALYIAESLTSWVIASSIKPRAVLDAAYAPLRGSLAALATVKPTFGAHRAGANVYPENTLEAVAACVEAGTDFINVDTWPLIDGGLGVMHDQTLDRTTSSSGNITDLDSAGVQQLVTDAGAWFGGGWGNLKVPLFAQIAAIAGNKVPLAIEAKPTAGSGATLVKILARYGLGPTQVIISSFNLQELAAPVAAGYTTQYVIGAADPTTIATSLVTNAGVKQVGINMTAAALATQAAKSAEVARWHAVGVAVSVYTALRKVETWPWLKAGVDDIAADEPLYLRPTWKPLTSDPFASGCYYHGTLSPAGTQSPSGRGFVGPTGFARFAKTTTNSNFVVQGWGSPIAGAIETTLQADAAAGATTLVVGPENRPLAGKPLTIDPAGTNPETRTPAADAVLNGDGTFTVTVPALTFTHTAGARVYGGTWTITVPITFDVMGNDTSRWPGVAVGSPNDYPYTDSGSATESGMLFSYRLSGQLIMSSRRNGTVLPGTPAAVSGGTPVVAPLILSAGLTTTATTALPVTATPAAIPAGAKFVLPTGQIVTTSAASLAAVTSVPINSVTPTAAVASGASLPNQLTMTIQRTVTAVTATCGGVSITWTDTTWFGGWFHLGMSSNAAGTQVSFGGASKVTVGP